MARFGKKWLVVLVLVGATVSPPPRAEPGGVLHGEVIDPGGAAADGYRVHVVDARGVRVAEGVVSDGAYRVRVSASGEFGMGVADPAGRVAPVALAPVALVDGRTVRRDIRLRETGVPRPIEVVRADRGLGLWWAGLGAAAKTWVVVGGLAFAGITAAAVADDDDEPASPF